VVDIMQCHITTSTVSVKDQQQKQLGLNVCRMRSVHYTEILNGLLV